MQLRSPLEFLLANTTTIIDGYLTRRDRMDSVEKREGLERLDLRCHGPDVL